MNPKKLATAAIAFLTLGFAAPANAVQYLSWNGGHIWANLWTANSALTWTPSGGHPWETVYFNGYTDSYMNHAVALPDLTATIKYTLDSVVGNTWKWDYTITDTSHDPVTASRISLFGFDVNPNETAATISGNIFNAEAFNGNVPILGNREVCFSAKSSGNPNCAGGGSGGVSEANTVANPLSSSGYFTLTFAPGTSQVSFTNLFVRFQAIDDPTLHINGGSGVGTPFAFVPEPATWAMMLLGFGGVGGLLRARRRSRTAAAA